MKRQTAKRQAKLAKALQENHDYARKIARYMLDASFDAKYNDNLPVEARNALYLAVNSMELALGSLRREASYISNEMAEAQCAEDFRVYAAATTKAHYHPRGDLS